MNEPSHSKMTIWTIYSEIDKIGYIISVVGMNICEAVAIDVHTYWNTRGVNFSLNTEVSETHYVQEMFTSILLLVHIGSNLRLKYMWFIVATLQKQMMSAMNNTRLTKVAVELSSRGEEKSR